MQFTPFDLEYTQSIWEQKVDINLTESGVHPIRLDELLGDDRDKIAALMTIDMKKNMHIGLLLITSMLFACSQEEATVCRNDPPGFLITNVEIKLSSKSTPDWMGNTPRCDATLARHIWLASRWRSSRWRGLAANRHRLAQCQHRVERNLGRALLCCCPARSRIELVSRLA